MNLAMRTLWFAWFFVAVASFAASGQGQPEPSFVVKIKYMKVDLPTSNASTCLAVFPDGRFRMEQISQWPVADPRIFEDSLPDEGFKSLSTILDAKDLKELKPIAPSSFIMSQGEMVQVIISRPDATQALSAIALDGSGKQVFKPLPEPLRPLVEWLQATTKSVNKRKLKPLKNAKLVNCWMGR
jgi:hypothetical protein